MSRQGHSRLPTYENIKEFWEGEAREIGNTPQVTIRDVCFRVHELHTLLPLVPACSRLLDVGCGTGFGTLALARRARYTLGIDYSDEMIARARKLPHDRRHRTELSRVFSPLWPVCDSELGEWEIEFSAGDVTALDLDCEPFNVVTGQRILINLPSHEDQMKTLACLRRHAAPDARLILTEATIQGHRRTDGYRAAFGLPELEKYWHNTYVDEGRFADWDEAGWHVEYDLGFETYMLLSKVVYPAACGPERCRFLSGPNAAAMEVACLFRSKPAVEEVGASGVFRLYAERAACYEPAAGAAIGSWLMQHATELPDWVGLGHQRLIVASAR